MRFLRSAVPSFLLIVGALMAVAWGTAYVSANIDTHQEHEIQIDQLRQELVALQQRVDALEPPPPPTPTPRPAARPGRPDPNKVYAVPVGDSPVLGNANALVTLIEFTDYQCPYCKRSQDTLRQVRERYGDDVRIVFKHNPLPFHRQAEPAAIAAVCAEKQGRFWEMSDLLWQNSRDLNDVTFRKLAKKIGLNLLEFNSCFKLDADTNRPPVQGLGGLGGLGAYGGLDNLEGQIQADKNTALHFGSRGTPAFFINGRFLSGARPINQFASLIDEELEKARMSNVSPRDYYDVEVMQKGERGVE